MNQPSEILLHVCCAPCAVGCVERLLAEQYRITLFFANSNIAPRLEYDWRLASVRDLAKSYELPLYEDDYRHEEWLGSVTGLEGEPEGGGRCRKCFAFSLARTAALAQKLDIGEFTTSLTVSPHKNSRLIFEAGSDFPGFLACDFKKRDGFRRSRELAAQHGFYRQNYCGCEFSLSSSPSSAAR